MQALTKTVFLCYAPAEREFAQGLGAFLERGADVLVYLDEGELRPGEDLAEKAREGRTADNVIVLFSRSSLPPRWVRAEWEPALVTEPKAENVRMAFVRCDDCTPPRVLAPMFERNQVRQVKRWLRQSAATFEPPEDVRDPGAPLEWLGVALADRPGGEETVDSTALAFEFVREFREDFDEVLYVECGERSRSAIAGDLAAAIGLKLEGPIEENFARLRDFCSARRLLILLDDAYAPQARQFVFGGRCSTLLSLGRWAGAPKSELRAAQDALAAGTGDWAAVCRHARTARRITRDGGRLAECMELMEQWSAAAEARGDRDVLNEASREMVWILEGWGRLGEAAEIEHRRSMEYDEQMRLF